MENIYPVYDQLISREEKEIFLNQKAGVFWLTGLSGSGKTTIAKQVEKYLFNKGFFVQIIDGDNVRSGLCNNLTFSLEDRKENIRRIAELTALSIRQGIICINTFVSPTLEIRQMAKDIVGAKDFHEIYINTTLEECENRDVKGLYKKARSGEIKGFTGIDSPFEPPVDPSLIISTNQTIQESASQLTDYIISNVQKI